MNEEMVSWAGVDWGSREHCVCVLDADCQVLAERGIRHEGKALGLELVESRRKLRPTVMAPALLLIGGLALRWVMVLAGQA